MITIASKRQLDLQGNKSAQAGDHIGPCAHTAPQIHLLNTNAQSGESPVSQQTKATSMSECPPEKISSSTNDGGKQKQGGNGKKPLV
ncbi:unnamed protein product [Urochloa humidicola]